MSNKINVLDAICGKGKTEAMINYINNTNKKILYITPFLSEVERIKLSCPDKKFKSPERRGSKIYDIKRLLQKGENIVSTHALFKMFDEETIDLTMLNDYTLIMDEVAEVVEVVGISKYDLDTLLEKYVEIEDNGMIRWISTDYEGEFEEYKKQAELNSLYIYSPSKKVEPVLLWMFPPSVFRAFSEVFVVTYMFDSQIQKYYYDYFGFEYVKWYLKDKKITLEYQEYDLSIYGKLINICEHEKLNSIGKDITSMSSTWYKRNRDNLIMKIIKNNCENYFKNITKTPTNLNMWTTFKEYKGLIKGKGYTKGFVSLGTRSTNEYIDKSSIAYLSNRYLNPIIKNFFISYGIEIDEDGYALSEIIQFLFRSRIRNGKEINVYIPNIRMRNILKKWIKNNVKTT